MGRRFFSVLLSVVVASALVSPATGATPTWSRTLGRDLQAVAVDAAGNVYVAGRTEIPGEGFHHAPVLAKYGPGGAKLWSRLWTPGASDYGYGSSVAVGSDGTIYWGGVVHPKGCEGGGWFVRAVTPGGRLLWHRDQDAWEDCVTATSLPDLAVGGDVLALALFDHGCCGDPFADAAVLALDPSNGSTRWRTDIEPAAGVPEAFFDRVTSVSVGGLGHVYVAGWAATAKVVGDTFDQEGVAYLQKLSSRGTVLWRRQVRRIDYLGADVFLSVRGDRLMVATIANPGGIYWGSGGPPAGWLGRFSLGGDLVWSRTWGQGWRHGAVPSGVSIGPGLETWIVGTTRDALDRGYDLFARRYSPSGAVTQTIRLDGPTKELWGGQIAAVGGGAAFTGMSRTKQDSIGRVWRYG